MDNNEIVEITPVEEKKEEVKRYVMLMQYKNEKRGAEIMTKLPNNKIELKALYLENIEKHDMDFDGAKMVDIFLVDRNAVDTIYQWTNWQISIAHVYEVCLDSWLNDKENRPYAKQGETYKGSFTDFIKPADFTEYTA
jgi:hypothetical protein